MKKQNKILTLIIQILAITLTIFWAYSYIYLILDETALTVGLILYGIIIGIIINFGLWLTTKQFAKKHKLITLFLLIPSIIFNSLFLPIGNIYFSIIIGLLINICALIILFNKGADYA